MSFHGHTQRYHQGYSSQGPINPPSQMSMPMPMAQPQRTYQPTSNSIPNANSSSTPYPATSISSTPYPATSNAHYPATSTTPYPTPNSTPYPSGANTPYPVTRTASNHAPSPQTSLNNEVDKWMNEVIMNLTGILKDAPNKDLESLMNNEDKLIELVQDTEQVKKLQRKRKSLIEFNKDQAVTNISLEPEIGTLRNELVQLINEQNALKEKQVMLYSQLSSRNSLDSTLAVLQAATSEKETETENYSQAFINGTIPIDEFIDNFIAERTIYQLRKIKSDKMTNLMRGGGSGGGGGRINTAPPIPPQRPKRQPQMPMPSSGNFNYGGYPGY